MGWALECDALPLLVAQEEVSAFEAARAEIRPLYL